MAGRILTAARRFALRVLGVAETDVLIDRLTHDLEKLLMPQLRNELDDLISKQEDLITKQVDSALKERDHSILIHPNDEEISIPKDMNMVTVSTVPRSGSYYAHYFFWTLNVLLGPGGSDFKVSDVGYMGVDVFENLNLAKLQGHIICPGFFEHASDEQLEEWKNFEESESIDGKNHNLIYLKNKKHVNPDQNENVRIVYIIRNPLDQITSLIQNVERNDIPDVYHEVSREEYLSGTSRMFAKHASTYFFMRGLFPHNILIVPYEELMRDKERIWCDILRFSGCSSVVDKNRDCITKAIDMCSLENLSKLEKVRGRRLSVNPGSKAGGTHMAGGEIGKWKNALSAEDVQVIEAQLSAFGLSMDMFIAE